MKRLDEVLTGVKSVGIAGHVKPDGDCIGSCLAVYNYIKTYYPDADARVYLEQVPSVFRFLAGADEICTTYPEETRELFLVLDCGDEKRLGNAFSYFEKAEKTVCIDHHISNQSFADVNYVYPDASSASELVFDLLPEEKITADIAACIYTGIAHDTGVFQYSCTSRHTMEAAGVLMEKGIPFSKIVDQTYYEKTYTENLILGVALRKAEMHLEQKVISSVITQEDLDAVSATANDVEGIVSVLRSTKGVEASVFLYQTGEHEFKLSLRSTEIIDCAKICMNCGGGGHVRAAGATVTGNPSEILEGILKEMEKQFAESL